jgi:spore coat polysaccharide biosynthesis predicted glycosyltransferase SpsG
MNKIVFVTRATKESGKGHIFRILRMIDNLSKVRECILVVDKEAITESVDFKFHPLDIDNPTILIDELKLNERDLLWFDIPDSQYQMLQDFNSFGIPLISTNMFEKVGEDRYENVGIYPVFEKYNKKILDNKTVQLSGVDFISLPDEFFYQEDVKFPQVLVSMGGTDPMGFTRMVLQSISEMEDIRHIYKIILPKDSCIDFFTETYGKYSHMIFHKFGSLDFASTLKRSEYAIINGGMTRYECVAARTFFIALSIHEQQAKLSEKVTKYGLGENFGVFNEDGVSRLSLLLNSLHFLSLKETYDENIPLLRRDGAKWIYEQVIKELNNENE